MKKPSKGFLLSVVAALAVLAGGAYWLTRPGLRLIGPTAGDGDGGPATAAFSYGDYAAVLKACVDDNGLVNYGKLKADHKHLNSFAVALARLDRGLYDKWSDPGKIAFWINAYNALTLLAIVEHYPIKSSVPASLVYPRNSIRQIPGVWDKLQFVVMDRRMTLNDIEHATLRKQFNEPRIHVALVCAAMGCPKLRNEPYSGRRLGDQLDDQSRSFLASPSQFRIDRRRGRVGLSSIFKWFGDDFVECYGTAENFSGHSKSRRATLAFASRYLSASDAEYLASQRYDIDYLDYDWSLNEQSKD
ncbi:MAG: DUF547 domain-containing protein [Anaerolineaceae bacterium]|nr:DUF547 domain-containing protein [Anaerolineaceae bacterium]